jgi:MFS family permease
MGEILALERNVLVLGLTSALGTFGNSLWYFLIPLYLRDLGVDMASMGLMYTANSLLVFVAQPFGGYLADRIGRKRVIIIGNLTGSCAILVLALSKTSFMAFPAYLLFNLGSVLPSPALNSMLTESVPEKRRGTAVGTFFTLASVLATLGPPLGGSLSEMFGYRILFMIGLSTHAIMVLARLLFLRETKQPASSLQRSPRFKEIWMSLRGIFGRRDLSMLFVAFGVYTGAISLTEFLIPLYAQEQLRLSPKEIGLMYSAPSIANVLFSLPSGKVADKLGKKNSVLLSWAGRSVFTLAYVYSKNSYLALLTFLGCTLFGIMDRPARIMWIADITQPENRGTMMGLFSTFTQVFALPSPALRGDLYHASPAFPFYANILLCVLSLAILLKFVPETDRRRHLGVE